MNTLFVDANIYLRFYDSSQPEYKKLLTTLVEVKDSIFVTEQLVHEVNRNKLSVFETSCTEPIADQSPRRTRLPEHFDTPANQSIKEWNKKRDAHNTAGEALTKEQITIYHDLLSAISSSKDAVSQQLEPIFALARSPSREQFDRAIQRKRIGNPPGKPEDPLGDQLSWEQFLDSVSQARFIWIISNDSDYLSSYKESCYLNPVLSTEIRKAAKTGAQVKCFNRLALGLKDFNDHLATKLATLPKEKELDQISKMERLPSLTGFSTGTLGVVPTYSGIQNPPTPLRLVQCPRCRSVDRIIGPLITVAGTDGFLFRYACQSCGNQWSETHRSGTDLDVPQNLL